jgi:riboflavin synthase alpha subunit
VGDVVNIETDILGKHERRRADARDRDSRITPESLARAGYL